MQHNFEEEDNKNYAKTKFIHARGPVFSKTWTITLSNNIELLHNKINRQKSEFGGFYGQIQLFYHQ